MFVDVGYLLAASGTAFLDTSYRPYVRCDYPLLVRAMVAEVERHSGLATLRVYWYDASYDAVPTSEQREIATIPGVKLRLGRMEHGRQKGVDSLIVRDLMTLARERAMATAYLLSGDEDVRVGVAAAQDMGARVVLLSIPGTNRAFTLTAEVDEELELPEDFWRPHFSRPTLTEMKAEVPEELTATDPAPGVGAVAPAVPGPFHDAFEGAARDAGSEFAREWGRDAPMEELQSVAALPGWRVPADIDRLLLSAADRELGFLRENPDLKAPLRDGFKAELTRVIAERRALALEGSGTPASE